MPTKIYTGRRKTSVARVRVMRGSGKFTLNGRPLVDYFPTDRLQATVTEPFKVTETEGQYDVIARLHGGGVSGQAEALRHGIARALEGEDPEGGRPQARGPADPRPAQGRAQEVRPQEGPQGAAVLEAVAVGAPAAWASCSAPTGCGASPTPS